MIVLTGSFRLRSEKVSEQKTFELGPKELVLSHVDIWRKRDPGRRKGKYRGPEMGMSKLSSKQ